MPALTTSLARHSQKRFDLVLTDPGIDVLTERIDLGLRLGTLDDSGALTARKISESPRRVLATPAYFRRMGVPAAPLISTPMRPSYTTNAPAEPNGPSGATTQT